MVLIRAKFVSEPTDPVAPGPLPDTEEPGAGVGAGQRDVLPGRGEHLPLLRRPGVGLVMVVLVESLAGDSLEREKSQCEVRDVRDGRDVRDHGVRGELRSLSCC